MNDEMIQAIKLQLELEGSASGISAPPISFMGIGIRFVITKNICPSLGLANQVTGVIKDIIFQKDTQFKEVDGFTVCSKLPEYILMELDISPTEELENYPNKVRPIPKISQSGTISYYDSCAYHQVQSYTYQAFPLLQADACTSHSVQGRTCECPVIIGKLRARFKTLSGVALYVAISRVRCLEDLFFTEHWTLQELQQFKPELWMLDILENLKTKSAETVETFFGN
jgi:hypothetical protein